MVPTKSSLCSPLNSYSLCLCLPSVPKRRERKKPTSHASKEKLVSVFFLFFHHSFLAFSESQICDAWKMLLLCSNKLLLYWKKTAASGEDSRPCLFAGLVFHFSDVGGHAASHVHRIKTKQQPFLLLLCYAPWHWPVGVGVGRASVACN